MNLNAENIVLNSSHLETLELNVDLDDVVDGNTLVEAVSRRVDELVGTCESLTEDVDNLSRAHTNLRKKSEILQRLAPCRDC